MRICLYSGPGAGKSTLASRLFADLKARGYSVELVGEYIKKWAYLKRVPKSFDQVYLFGQQMHAEDVVYQCGVEHLVTDAPLFMQPFYSKTYNFSAWNELMMIAKQYEKIHPSLNIFLDRKGLTYQQNGRYESADLALERDDKMKEFLQEQSVPFVTFKTLEYDAILSYVELHLAICNNAEKQIEEQVKKELKKRSRRKKRSKAVEIPDYTADDYKEYTCS